MKGTKQDTLSCWSYQINSLNNSFGSQVRLDNEWVDTGLASREAYELCKYGEILQV